MQLGQRELFVQGSSGPKRHFSGRTSWVEAQRRWWRPAVSRAAEHAVQFATRQPGFQGAVLALDRTGIAVEKEYRFERELSYETIPSARPPPNRA